MKEIAGFLGKYFKGDSGIWAIMLIFSILSVAAVYSATGLLAYRYQGGHTAHYMLRHALLLAGGWVIMFVFHRVRYTNFARGTIVFLVLSLALLVYTLTMAEVNGASRWVRVLGFSFQPSELAKVVIVVFMARQLAKYQPVIQQPGTFWRLIWAPLAVGFLIFFDNLSTAALLFLTCFTLLVVGGVSAKHVWGMAGAGVLGVAILLGIFRFVPEEKLPGRFETWKNRIENFRSDNPEDDYQETQAKIAVAGGKIFGKGPGNSTQRNFLPHPYSDYVYALIIEEYGMVAGLGILLLYLWFLRRGISIARRSQGSFGSYLVLGLTFMLTLQAMVNMGVAVDLLPVTGQPLPFLSMGGTAVWFTAMAVGMIQSVAVSVKEQESREESGKRREKKIEDKEDAGSLLQPA